MATYLVLRRITWGDRSASFANEVLELDPLAEETAIFLKRGHITPVPTDYPGAVSSPAEKAAGVFSEPGSPTRAKSRPSSRKVAR
jgi:hypothetical protein